jgi:hypothetical protein
MPGDGISNKLVPGFGPVITLMCVFTGELPELRILENKEVLRKTVINQGEKLPVIRFMPAGYSICVSVAAQP